MAHTRCMLDKQGYMHARAYTRPRARPHARARAHTHTHTQMSNIYCFSTATITGERNAPQCYIVLILPVSFSFSLTLIIAARERRRKVCFYLILRGYLHTAATSTTITYSEIKKLNSRSLVILWTTNRPNLNLECQSGVSSLLLSSHWRLPVSVR